MALSSILRYCPLVDIQLGGAFLFSSVVGNAGGRKTVSQIKKALKMFSIVFDPFCPPARIIAFDAMPLISVGPWVLCQFWGAADKQMSSRFENCLFGHTSKDLNRGYGWARWVSRSPSRPFTKLMLMNDTQYWILNSSNWYWTDTESIISVLYYINVYFLKCQRSFYHAFLKFRFNKPWPGPRIRTSRQSELGLALWVLLNVCVGPTLRWKAHLEGNGCAKQRSVYSV